MLELQSHAELGWAARWDHHGTVVLSEYQSYKGVMELEGVGKESKENNTDVLREAGLP